MVIEQATTLDAKEILALQKLAYISEAEIYNDFTIQPLHQILNEMILEIESQYVLKCVVNDRIVGSVRAYMAEETCFICKLIVHPKFQNQGIGTKLLKEIENHFNHTKLSSYSPAIKARRIFIYIRSKVLKYLKVKKSMRL